MTSLGGASEQPVSLVVTDVDGTLVTDNKQLTSRSIEAVRRLGEAGIAFTLISARPPRGMATLVRDLDIGLPFAAFDGGSLVAPDGTVLSARRLAPEAGRRALDLLAREGVAAWVFGDGEWRLSDLGQPKVALERMTVGFDATVVADPGDVRGGIDKIVAVSDDPARLHACEKSLREALAGAASVKRSQSYYVDITAPGAEKGGGLRALCARIGVDPARVAVLGDMMNDTPMFEVAGFSIAMGQAPAAVRAAARAVTASNSEDGFAEAVEKLILPRGPRGR